MNGVGLVTMEHNFGSEDDFSLNGQLVLIAEDELMIGLLARDAVERLGGRCAPVVKTCEEALRALATDLPDLIILDLNLRGGTSERVLDAALVNGIPVVVSSGTTRESLPRKFQELPRLEKPWQLHDMETVLKLAVAAPNSD